MDEGEHDDQRKEEKRDEAFAPTLARISCMGDELEAFLADSEETFVQTGKRLDGLAQRSAELVSSAERNLTVDSSEGASTPAASLSTAIASMERHFEASRSAADAGQAALSGVLRETDEVTGIGAEFQRIARAMRALATSLRIEEGRGGRSDGFDLVASEVIKFGDLIGEKFHQILARATSLHAGAAGAHEKACELLRKERASSAVQITEAKVSLEKLAELDARTADLRKNAIGSAREIARASNEVLLLLQAHDISRQMLEHVIEALKAPESPEAIPILCRIQAKQINVAHSQLAHAYSKIAENLKTVCSRVVSITEKTASFSEGEQLLSNVEGGVTELVAELRNHLMQEQETFSATFAVVTASAGMTDFIHEIATIAHDVKVLALNSLVKAVRAGNRGAVFAILAEAVQGLATDVARDTQRVAESMHRMADIANTSNRATRTLDEECALRIETNLTTLLSSLRHYHDELFSSLRAMTQGTATLADDVTLLTSQLASQSIAAELLCRTERELLTTADRAETLLGAARDRDPSTSVPKMSQYTMEAERAIHRVVTGEGDPASVLVPTEATPQADANVEFF